MGLQAAARRRASLRRFVSYLFLYRRRRCLPPVAFTRFEKANYMKTKQKLTSKIKIFVATMLIIVGVKAAAQLPTNFPALTVTTNDAPNVANGYMFLTDSYKAAKYGY